MSGVTLVLCNGIGASLDVLDPLVEHLHSDTAVVRFDAPGIGGQRIRRCPTGFLYLATMLGRLLRRLRLNSLIDVLGFSWSGALAQQFVFQNPRRCRQRSAVSTIHDADGPDPQDAKSLAVATQ